jgi:hypothetical protein
MGVKAMLDPTTEKLKPMISEKDMDEVTYNLVSIQCNTVGFMERIGLAIHIIVAIFFLNIIVYMACV